MTKRAHYISAWVLIVFTLGHLVNHLMLLDSETLHIAYMDAFRKVYRFLPIEILIYLCCAIQAVTGFLLVRKVWTRKKDLWERLQVYSGLYFLYFIIVHPLAVLAGRYLGHLDTNLYFGASVLNIKPFLYYFIFHYGLAVSAFFTHIACVHRIRMARYTSLKASTRQAQFIIGLGLLVGVTILVLMMDIEIPKAYSEGLTSLVILF